MWWHCGCHPGPSRTTALSLSPRPLEPPTCPRQPALCATSGHAHALVTGRDPSHSHVHGGQEMEAARCPPADKQTNKTWSLPTVDGHSVLNRREP